MLSVIACVLRGGTGTGGAYGIADSFYCFYSILLFISQVNVKIAGIDYNLRFDPAVTSPSSLAQKFCNEQGPRLGVTAETFDQCMKPVATYLQQEVDADRS